MVQMAETGETPRTDAETGFVGTDGGFYKDNYPTSFRYVPADFARTLERTIAALRVQLAAAEKENTRLQNPAVMELEERVEAAEKERDALRLLEGTERSLREQAQKSAVEIELECREAWKQAAHWRSLAEQAERTVVELERLHERLEDNHAFDSEGKRIELTPGSIPDGIDCRNETIKLLDRRIEKLQTALTAERSMREQAERTVVELRELLREISETWALHGIAPELEKRIAAALQPRR